MTLLFQPEDRLQQHYQLQLTEKQQRLSLLLNPFFAGEIAMFASAPRYFRLRAEFRIWRESGILHYAMFRRDGQRCLPVLVDDFPVAAERINALMPLVRMAWEQHAELAHKLFQVTFLTSFAGDDAVVTFCYHRQLADDWTEVAQRLSDELGVSLIGRSRGQKIVVGCDYVEECLTIDGKRYHYRQPEAAFSQPNGQVNQQMVQWVCDMLGDSDDDLLEMYCGQGNFTIPAAGHVRKVLTTEVSKAAVQALQHNVSRNGVDNVALARLSAEELAQALDRVRSFRRLAHIDLDSYRIGTVLVDPPRAGLGASVCRLLSRFTRIIYISCNPSTQAEDLRHLASTHQVRKLALFDQFPWTSHIESGVVLEKRI